MSRLIKRWGKGKYGLWSTICDGYLHEPKKATKKEIVKFIADDWRKEVEERIKDHSYTDKWYHIDSMRFQVYKTKSGKEYIIILNERETKYIRKYLVN